MVCVNAPNMHVVTNGKNQRGNHSFPQSQGGSTKRGYLYKILPPGCMPNHPIGCTGINQSEEWKPSNVAQYE